MHPSHAGVVVYLLRNFRKELKEFKNKNISETEIDSLFIKSFENFSAPIKDKLNIL